MSFIIPYCSTTYEINLSHFSCYWWLPGWCLCDMYSWSQKGNSRVLLTDDAEVGKCSTYHIDIRQSSTVIETTHMVYGYDTRYETLSSSSYTFFTLDLCLWMNVNPWLNSACHLNNALINSQVAYRKARRTDSLTDGRLPQTARFSSAAPRIRAS